MTTEKQILCAAHKNFVLYGYNGTKLSKIAKDARVSKTLIHYYYRSKIHLYQCVVKKVGELVLNQRLNEDPKVVLFIIKELQSNKDLLLRCLNAFSKRHWRYLLILNIQNSMAEMDPGKFMKMLQ